MSNLSGKRVMLVRMEDPYTNLKSGDEGTINGTDDMGQILVKWDNGSTLSLLPEIDEYEIYESKKLLFLQKFESYNAEYDSSISVDDATKIVSKIEALQNSFNKIDIKDLDDIILKCEKRLSIYDKINREFVIDTIFYTEVSYNTGEIIDNLISIGDKIMSRYGTEPRMVLNAFDDAISSIPEKYKN